MPEHTEPSEELIEQHVAESNTQAAVSMLFELIVRHAREKNFPKAEALRARLFEIDAFALSEIVKSGDIIEEEKRGTISSNHLRLWATLFSRLAQEETNALYYAFRKARYDPAAVVFRQGEHMPRLFFINDGQAKLSCISGNRDVLLRSVVPGDVAGDESFFSYTVCTQTFTALTSLEVQYLEQEVLATWRESMPALEEKLHEYCLAKKMSAQKLEEPDRRSYPRFRIAGAISFQLLTSQGASMGNVFSGDLSDISHSGLSFHLKIATRDNARMLLGRTLGMKLTIPAGEVVLTGIVVAVHSHPFEDYSVHVRFHKLLPEQSLSSLPPIR